MTATATRKRIAHPVVRVEADATPADIVRALQRRADREHLEASYLQQVRALRLPPPIAEFRFHPARMWRIDYAFLRERIAVELDGGTWLGSRGGHTGGSGFTRDREKQNELACAGWLVLRFTAEQVASGAAIEWTRRALTLRRRTA